MGAEGQEAAESITAVVDHTAPVVTLGEWEPAAVAGGGMRIEAQVLEAHGPSEVRFFLNGDSLGLPLAGPPYLAIVATGALAAGRHELRVEAEDDAGNLGSASKELFTDAPPSVELIEPGPDTTLHGPTQVVVAAEDDLGLERVELLVDGVLVGPFDAAGTLLWTPSFVRGERVLTARAIDTSGHVTEAEATVLVDHPLAVAIEACREEDCTPVAQGSSLAGPRPDSGSASEELSTRLMTCLMESGCLLFDNPEQSLECGEAECSAPMAACVDDCR